jgi:hypothetical protein
MTREETIEALATKLIGKVFGPLNAPGFATTIYDQFIAPLEAERASERARSIKDAEWLETERLAAEAARDEALALLKEARDYTIVTAYCVSSGSLLARIDAALAQPVMEKEEG